ncbi:MAG: hypothetical protein AABX54_00955 [Nanoarchaeota archaeon]
MVKITIEDIVFWIIILFIIGIIIWMLNGSPTTESALISVGGALISSELLLWKKFYSMDKKTSMNFMKIKHEMSNSFINLKNDLDKNNIIINNRFDVIENKLDNLKKKR